MGIDLLQLQNDKGGNFEAVAASQKKRNAPEELAHDVLAMYKEWTKSASLVSSSVCTQVGAAQANPSSPCNSPVRRPAAAEGGQQDSEGDRPEDEGALALLLARLSMPRRTTS